MEVGRVVAMDTAICFLLSPPILPGFILLPTVLPSRPLHPTCSACCTPLWPSFLSDCGCRWIGYGLKCEEGSNGSARVLQKTEPIGSVHTHTHVCTHTFIYIQSHIYTHVRIYHTLTQIHIHTHLYTYAHSHTYKHICAHTLTHVHPPIHIHTYTHRWTSYQSSYLFIHLDLF
jgi:hypothetical protein